MAGLLTVGAAGFAVVYLVFLAGILGGVVYGLVVGIVALCTRSARSGDAYGPNQSDDVGYETPLHQLSSSHLRVVGRTFRRSGAR